MLNRFSLAVCALLVFGLFVRTSAAQVRQTWVVGVVQRVQSGAVDVMGDNHEVVTVTLNPDTKYSKWILAKPWQQESRANLTSLRPGVRVRIEVERSTARPTARTVWVVVGRPGFM